MLGSSTSPKEWKEQVDGNPVFIRWKVLGGRPRTLAASQVKKFRSRGSRPCKRRYPLEQVEHKIRS
jgi:hypothetical protein